MVKTTDSLKLPLFLMKLGGVHPQIQNAFSYPSFTLMSMCTVLLIVLSILDYFLTENTVTNFAQKFEGSMTISQFALKGYILVNFRKNLSEIIDKIYNFKQFENITEPVLKQIDKMALKEVYWGRFYVSAVSFSLLFFIGKPFFPGHELPLRCYVPEKFFLTFNFIFVTETILLTYALFIVIAHDIVFSAICLQVCFQFKLLSEEFKKIEVDKYKIAGKENVVLEQLKSCIYYHQFLTEFVDELQVIFSPMLLTQLLITTGTLCMELYIGSITR